MDINEYIATGILEKYVLNDVSAQEMQEVECLSHIYPEIGEELTRLQRGLEKVALAAAVTPPANLKRKVFEEIQKSPRKSDEQQIDTPIIELHQQAKKVRLRKIMAAASFAGLIALGTYAFILVNQLSTTQDELATQETKLENLQRQLDDKDASVNALEENLAALEEEVNFLEDPQTQRINLAGTDKYPTSLATVFWNQQSTQVKLNPANLPTLADNESYQLWILVDGVPQDMGVLNKTSESADDLINMQSTEMADAFAITVEPLGGSESPTLTNLCVIGNVPTI